MKIERFILTADHIKLLRHAYVGWNDCETGAPEIDPKRPYGNSDVNLDIHEILTGESVGMADSNREGLTDKEMEKYTILHRETEEALQIILSTGRFQPGIYEKEPYGKDWKLINAQLQSKIN